MIKISDIYVITTLHILQMIYICWCKENTQQSISDNPDFNIISMGSYKGEILPTFMLSSYVLVKTSLTLVYVEVISNIKC